jgi:hypothetical protein
LRQFQPSFIMKKISILIATFISCTVYGQYGVDLNTVRDDPGFTCKTNFSDSIYFNLRSICYSKNDMEIRLIIQGFKGPKTQIVLAYKDSAWILNKYKYQTDPDGTQVDITRFDRPNKFYTDLTFRSVFPILLVNDIFTLPDQEELHIQPTIYDGVSYTIQYKVKNKFRSYVYFNPQSYSEMYPEKKELKKIAVIVETMKGLFH